MQLDADLQKPRASDQAEPRAENPRLKTEMDDLKERIDQLSAGRRRGLPGMRAAAASEDRQQI